MLHKYLCLVVGALLLLSTPSMAQCTGSLGAPIVNITFGQGANPGSPLAAAVPGAATTYIYDAASGTPPANTIIDGEYSLINQVPNNTAWHVGATDHTGNSKGYMAFFNAAPQTGEFYKQTVSNLCPGTTYEFAAWILNAINSATAIGATASQPDVTFRITDMSNNDLIPPFVTGPIPANTMPIWHQYATSFTTPPGVGSVILSLSNTVAGGPGNIGNDLALDDITFRPCGPLTAASFSASSTTLETTVCTGQAVNLYGSISGGLTNPAYQWQMSADGITWTDIAGATTLNVNLSGQALGNYQIRLLSAEAGNIGSANCRFISNVIYLTAQACNNCSDTCFWKVTGNNIINGNNIFGTLSKDDVRIQTDATDRGILTQDGLWGWHTMLPTAYLHVNCSGNNDRNGMSDIRFENLETGDGNIMVINEAGYVWNSRVPLKRFTDNSETIRTLQRDLADARERTDRLEQELSDMRIQLKAVIEASEGGGRKTGTSLLYQNTPNPFSKTTIIGYYIDNMTRDAYLAIYDMTGKELTKYLILKEGKGSTNINAEQFANGVYMYSLIVDGNTVDTKKMILNK